MTARRVFRGVREAARLRYRLDGDQGPKATPVEIHSPADVWRFMQPYADAEPCEVMWVLPLDAKHRTRGPVEVSRGLVSASLVHPREVMLRALVANASGIVLVHNHPSGDPTPSEDDRMVTQQMVAAGRTLDIPVHDHVVIGDGRYASLSERGEMC